MPTQRSWQAEVDAAAGYCFNLDHELPIRAWLLRLSPADHVLVVVVHHIAADGWSMTKLLRDLGTAYAARLHGTAPAWGPLPVQYADYTLWQDALLGDTSDPHSVLGDQLAYWQARLAGLPEQITLPTDRPRPAVASYRGGTVPLLIDADLHAKLLALARAHGATLFMVLQAGLAVLLGRLGGGEDITIGTPIAGRTDAALDELVGFFVNSLVLRTDLSGDPDFATVLARVREASLGAYAHQDVPFERLIEALNPPRSQSHHPLFQVALAVQDEPAATLELEGVLGTPVPFGLDVAKFDLTLYLTQLHGTDGNPAGLSGAVEYASDLFDASSCHAIWDPSAAFAGGDRRGSTTARWPHRDSGCRGTAMYPA